MANASDGFLGAVPIIHNYVALTFIQELPDVMGALSGDRNNRVDVAESGELDRVGPDCRACTVDNKRRRGAGGFTFRCWGPGESKSEVMVERYNCRETG